MKSLQLNNLIDLLKCTDRLRNICILAHVDHGKTTLADALIASNGIISDRMIGQLRYMDSLPDEQERGITMKSSAIALHCEYEGAAHLINLVDSPGHVDFCGEVSTATRLCDGALIVVDAVEGVCPQTITLLRHAWSENLKPVLVLNKIDRLILELKLSADDIYKHLRQVLEKLNALAGQYFTSKMMQINENQETSNENGASQIEDTNFEMDEEKLYFNPSVGNVIFASAYDGWAFRIDDFARIWAKKTKFSENVLKKTLWGDFFIDEKAQRVKKGAANKGKKCLFVKMIMENLCALYDSVVNKNDRALALKMIQSFQLKVAPRDLVHRDAKIYIRAILQQWLPLGRPVLNAVCYHMPAPNNLTPEKMRRLFPLDSLRPTLQPWIELLSLKNAFESEKTVAFVSKLYAVETSLVKERRKNVQNFQFQLGSGGILSEEEIQAKRDVIIQMKSVRFDEQIETRTIVEPESKNNIDIENDIMEKFTLLAFTRVYSGCLEAGQKLFVIPTQSAGAVVNNETQKNSKSAALEKITIQNIYLMMGRELVPVEKAPAGSIVALSGLSNDLSGRAVVLSSDPECPPFDDLLFYAEPILKIFVEPQNPCDLHQMIEGLKLLSKVDPMVKTFVEDTGEHTLATAGEVHLRRCKDDLTKRYFQLDLHFSEPIVPFSETIVKKLKSDQSNEPCTNGSVQGSSSNNKKSKCVELQTPNKLISVKLKASPLSEGVIRIIEQNEMIIAQIESILLNLETFICDDVTMFELEFLKFYDTLQQALLTDQTKTRKTFSCQSIWSFGPKKARCNLLLNKITDYHRPSIFQLALLKLRSKNPEFDELCGKFSIKNDENVNLRDLDQSVVNGFRFFCRSGPICAETVRGVAILVENWTYLAAELVVNKNTPLEELKPENEDDRYSETSSMRDSYGPLSGQLMTVVKEACKQAFQAQPQRLMAAMYACTIKCTTEVLGRVYAVLNKRNGRVIGEEMNEGTNIFEITAVLPVAESFGFCDEIRKRTSAQASPQLVFSHFEIIDIDPFWVPRTQDELEHYGTKADFENPALKYMNMVRKRKGLAVEEQVVEKAEKQRTLMKK